jgi:GTPase SAR1 family protein
MVYIQIVIGPAGVGKSSYCKTLQDHGKSTKRVINIANLDPAAEYFAYETSFDIRELVQLDAVMEEFGFGPNGGLVYCMEYLLQNTDWLKEQLGMFGEDEYVVFDCPGQIELYSHLPIMHDLVKAISSWGYRVGSVYLLDALFVLEPAKFISGCMLSLSCMMQLELPHINVITKCDMADKEQVEMVLDAEGPGLIRMLDQNTPAKMKRLTAAMGSVIEDYMIVSFCMLDITDEQSIEEVLARIDHAIQYGEDLEPKEPKEDEERDEDN